MKSSKKRGGVRVKKKTKSKNGWNKDPLASLKIKDNMLRRVDDVEDVNEYLHLLSSEEKLWMAKFMDEYNNARLDFEDYSKNMVPTAEWKKICTDRNNARNRCTYTIEKAQNGLDMAGDDKSLEALIYGNNNMIDEDEIDDWYDDKETEDSEEN